MDQVAHRGGLHSSGKPSKKQRILHPPSHTSSVTTNTNEGRHCVSSMLATNNVGDAVTELNSEAMALYSLGDFDTAASLFRKAICLRMEDARGALTEPENDKVEASAFATCCRIIPPPSSYIYQRTDFDEGLNVYSEPMPLQKGDHPQAVESTLLFNAGQARKKLNDMEGASTFYDRAVKAFLPYQSKTSAAAPCSVNDITAIQTNHGIVIPLLHAIGQLAYTHGKLDDALLIYETALRLCHDIYGKNHISVGRTLNAAGVICYHLCSEKSKRAKTFFVHALEIQTEFLGRGSLEVATTYNNLGRVHVQREEFGAALALYEKAMEIRIQLGEDHIDFAATQFNAGQSCHQLGDFDRALAYYQGFLRVALKKFSRKHRDVAVVLSGIAQIYQENKDYDKALSLYEESLVVGRAALGNSHPEVAMLLNRLGNFYFDRGMFDKALTAYEEGLQIESRVLEEAHPNIIVTLTNIGEIYRQRSDFENSIRLYLDALRLQKNCYGPTSLEVASTLNVLGLIYDLHGSSTTALSCLQEALIIRRSVMGDNHLDVSATLTYLGSIFYRRGASCLALELFSESLRIRIDNLGKNHRDVSFTLYNVGLCHFNVGSYAEAIICYKETLRIEQVVLVENHRDMACTQFKLGEVYAANRELDLALASFQAALAIERETDAEPKTIARILNEIGNIHITLGNLEKMMNAFIGAARSLQEAGLFHPDSLSLPGQLYAFGAACPDSAAAA